jgi:hypothetical protein
MSTKLPRSSVAVPLLIGIAATAVSCGARTPIAESLTSSTVGVGGAGGAGGQGTGGSGGVGGQGPGGSGGAGGQGAGGTGAGGGTTNPVISAKPDSFIESETSTATAANGFVSVAWIDILQSGGSAIGYVFSTDDGKSFPEPSSVSSPDGRQASDPVLAVDAAGGFYLSWVGYYIDDTGTPSDMHVYVAKAPPGATSFGEPVTVSNLGGNDDFYDKPWITVTNDGTILVTYAVFSNVSSKLMAARSKDGVNWAESTILESGSAFYNLAFPCAPQNGTRIYTTYLVLTNVIKVGLSFSDDQGASWSPLVKSPTVSLAEENVAFTDPSCVAAGNEVWVAYGLTDEPLAGGSADTPRLTNIRAVRSSDQGASFDLRLEAGDASAAPYFLLPGLVREESGALDVVYYAGTGDEDSEGTFRRARMADPALGFSPSQVIEKPVTYLLARDDPRWLGDYIGVATRGDRLYTSYVVNTDGLAHVAFARPALP